MGDLGAVPFRGDFDLVVMTGHVFQVFLADDDIRAALAAARALTDGGRLAFETLNPLLRPWERRTGTWEDALLAAAGLAVAERYGHWDRRPFTAAAPEIITIATGA